MWLTMNHILDTCLQHMWMSLATSLVTGVFQLHHTQIQTWEHLCLVFWSSSVDILLYCRGISVINHNPVYAAPSPLPESASVIKFKKNTETSWFKIIPKMLDTCSGTKGQFTHVAQTKRYYLALLGTVKNLILAIPTLPPSILGEALLASTAKCNLNLRCGHSFGWIWRFLVVLGQGQHVNISLQVRFSFGSSLYFWCSLNANRG